MTMETEEPPAPEPGPSTALESDQPDLRVPESTLSSQRVFKKSSPNSKLTMYLASRDLVVSQGKIDRLTGVLLVDPEFVDDRKVYGQITLTFRYGREDEEVMGLKFCNEAVMCLTQLYPPPQQPIYNTTPLQEALLKRLGSNAYPFTMEVTPLAPPSVQLVPAKEYNGAPIGTSYDVRAYVAERIDEKLHKRTTVRMGIRVVQRAFAPPSPYRYVPGGGKTSKEQAKINRKALLFGCKSAPLDNRFFTHQEAISRSAETVTASQPDFLGVSQMRTGHHSMPECLPQGMDTLGIQPSHDTKSPNRKSPPKPTGHVTFDEQDDDDTAHIPAQKGCLINEPLRDETEVPDLGDAKRRMSLKSGGPEVRTDSVESNEDRISDYYRSLCSAKRPSMAAYLAEVPNPEATIEKPFLLSDGKVMLSATLDKGIYSHGEEIKVSVQVKNSSNKTIRRIKVFVVQHVDVCMFSNGKFKNVVALVSDKESCPVVNGTTLNKTYTLLPINSTTKNWIALEDTYTKSNSSLASTVCSVTGNADDRNVFAIYVSYYVKVKLIVSVMGGDVSLKLPFTLMHTCTDYDGETLTRVKKIETDSRRYVQPPQAQRKTELDIKPEKDGT
ncbi:arrestin homolog [Euwallacea similis]|uniref:arrestin homolog n=1 Tax=Euwallacea similis TaxID=1736056 RepID=UPI00344DB75C